MTDSIEPHRAPQPRLSAKRQSGAIVGRRIGLLLACTAIAASVMGCTSMWNRLRERERIGALNKGRVQTGRGQCGPGLASIDRAQARLDLGLYARESTAARTRCYEKLGMAELAAAHRRLTVDFYTNEPMAFPEADGSSIFRVETLMAERYERPPGWLKIPAPRYSPYAQRSKIVGRVVISFELASNHRPKKIRVLEMPHPLLATWAIEAIASAEPSKRKTPTVVMPGGRYVTTFVFEWRWAEPQQVDELES